MVKQNCGNYAEGIALIKADIFEKRLNDTWNSMKQEIRGYFSDSSQTLAVRLRKNVIQLYTLFTH